MPANKAGKRITVGDYNRQDGFSPGQTIVVRVKGLHTQQAFKRSKLVPLVGPRPLVREARRRRGHQRAHAQAPADLRRARRQRQARERHACCSSTRARTSTRAQRYIVALRGLRTASGKQIKPSKGFAALKRGKGPKRLRKRYKGIFKTLRRAGIAKGNLTLAWDFTVASERGLTARMLHIRDDAFAQLGDRNLADGKVEGSAPEYTITKVVDNPDPRILRRISGTFTVPCYLNVHGLPARRALQLLEQGKDALPAQLPGQHADREVRVRDPARRRSRAPRTPRSTATACSATPTRSTRANIKAMSQEHDFAFCATAWSGMSSEDVPNAVKLLGDLSGFASLADRNQQGFLNQLYLGRLFIHPQGLTADPAFKGLVDPSQLYFDGNSQGGIFGAALTAMAPDFTRAVLGVPGINFWVLLTRARIGQLRRGLQPGLPARVRATARAVADQHAVGPRRG